MMPSLVILSSPPQVRLSSYDEELKTAVAALTPDDIQNRTVYRGENFQVSSLINLTIYNEALLIFYGKISVYLKAMSKSIPQQWQEWIG
jgi:hypothetical protein